MKKGQIFDLAYEFRNSKLWKQIYEEELYGRGVIWYGKV